MIQQEIEKKADEYVEMFINIDYIQNAVPIGEASHLGISCALKLVDELIVELFYINDRTSDCNSYIHNKLSDLQQVKEVLTNRLK